MLHSASQYPSGQVIALIVVAQLVSDESVNAI